MEKLWLGSDMSKNKQKEEKKKPNLLTNLVQFASWDGAVPE